MHTLLRYATTAFLLLGIGTILVSGTELVQANLGGQGTMLLAPSSQISVTTNRATPKKPATISKSAEAEARLMLGMLLVLAGFGFHVLYLVRHQRLQTRRRKHSARRVAKSHFKRGLRVRIA